ncbi:MAG: TatD family hydrolase [Candidatus Aenigmatarchaeota archaeon]
MIDCHCHLEYMEKPEEVVAEARKRGMSAIITSSPDPKNFASMIALQHANEHFVYVTAGFHPHHISDYSPTERRAYMDFIRANRYDIVGIGEVGLDYKDATDTLLQQEVFAEFVDLALELDMPVIIHCRDAFPDVLKILAEKKVKHAVFHCFSGSEGTLKFILKQPEWFVSFATNICYTEKHKRLAKLVPLNRMLLETDAPWLDPDVPAGAERGLTNRPWKIARSAEVIAALKGFKPEEVLATTATNARHIFKFV